MHRAHGIHLLLGFYESGVGEPFRHLSSPNHPAMNTTSSSPASGGGVRTFPQSKLFISTQSQFALNEDDAEAGRPEKEMSTTKPDNEKGSAISGGAVLTFKHKLRLICQKAKRILCTVTVLIANTVRIMR